MKRLAFLAARARPSSFASLTRQFCVTQTHQVAVKAYFVVEGGISKLENFVIAYDNMKNGNKNSTELSRLNLVNSGSSAMETAVEIRQRLEFQPKFRTIAINSELHQYISVFKYGSVVMFNIPEHQHREHLKRIRESWPGISYIAEDYHLTEAYKILINPHLDKPSVIKAEHVNIRSLDNNNITIVATVMAQTVALEHYANKVDKMLRQFMQMNMKIEETGNFQHSDFNMQNLYKHVASNNTVIYNVLSELGFFEGNEAAWDNADYTETWEGMRKDFELDNRFKDLEKKLNIVKDNTRFFLEILHNQKSNKSEYTIIVLICFEIFIAVASLYVEIFHA